MTTKESLEKLGLVPNDESLSAIRQILANEAYLEREGKVREDDLALLCCVQLFSKGLLEDVLLIWEAKQSGFDLGCYLDGEFLLGAGLEKTKIYLMNHPTDEAKSALEYIENRESMGDFAGWSPDKHLEFWQQYFEV